MHTIPGYLTDPAHYWTFTVSLADPDSALRHSAWRPTITGQAAPPPNGPVPTTTATSGRDDPYTSGSPRESSNRVSFPGGSTEGDRYTPGSGTEAATGELVRARIRLIRVSADPVRERLSISFSARANASPTVSYSREKPVRDPSSGRWSFPRGGSPTEVAAGPAEGLRAEYRAQSSSLLSDPEGDRFHYIITVPSSAEVEEEQLAGEFSTQATPPPPPSDGFNAR
jgi:hypothetical protein